MRVVLGVEYNGAQFCGWQSQPNGCSVQDALEKAISAFTQLAEPLRVVCAGRTDTGVHAWAQVVHLDTELVRTEQSWIRGTNTALPSSIRVVWACCLEGALAEAFHARFSATRRSYQYLLLNDPVAPATLTGLVGWHHAPLDVALMQQAADLLVGTHDFSAFRSSECQAKSPVKTLDRLSIRRQGQLVVFDCRANAFLHHMVRNIVGALIAVGVGRLTVDEFQRVFEGGDRSVAPPTFSPDGLYLSEIEYDARFGLPAFPERRLLSSRC